MRGTAQNRKNLLLQIHIYFIQKKLHVEETHKLQEPDILHIDGLYPLIRWLLPCRQQPARSPSPFGTGPDCGHRRRAPPAPQSERALPTGIWRRT
jgi:hypothetical protein